MNATISKETPIGGCLERLVGLPGWVEQLNWRMRRRLMESVLPGGPLTEYERLERWLYYDSGDSVKDERTRLHAEWCWSSISFQPNH
jgi:hypothetical protein